MIVGSTQFLLVRRIFAINEFTLHKRELKTISSGGTWILLPDSIHTSQPYRTSAGVITIRIRSNSNSVLNIIVSNYVIDSWLIEIYLIFNEEKVSHNKNSVLVNSIFSNLFQSWNIINLFWGAFNLKYPAPYMSVQKYIAGINAKIFFFPKINLNQPFTRNPRYAKEEMKRRVTNIKTYQMYVWNSAGIHMSSWKNYISSSKIVFL